MKEKDIKHLVNEIQEWIKNPVYDDGPQAKRWADKKMQQCVDIIGQLQEENESLWHMLEEIKEADMKNYAGEFQEMLDRKMVEVKLLAMTEPAEA